MAFTVAQIADALNAPCVGAGEIRVKSLAEAGRARQDQLALALWGDFARTLKDGAARAAILSRGADWQALGLEAAIFVDGGRRDFAKITQFFDPRAQINPGIHASAIIDDSAKIGAGAMIAPLVVIAKGTKIGANAKIFAHASIGENTIIGDNALILSGVKIEAQTRIGDNFIAQPGAVIGSDGLAFENDNQEIIDNIRKTLGQPTPVAGKERIGDWHRIYSLGGVSIGDDVEIGANTTIDRGTLRDTSIGARTKIDNLVHIAHNVRIGTDCLICAQTGMAGSATLGNRIIMAGKCGVGDNITIGDDVFVGGASKIFSSVKAGKILLGSPATDMSENIKTQKMLRRLPRFFAKLSALEKKSTKPE